MEFDLKLVGGILVDGTGAPGRPGELGIADGRITAVGRADGAAAETIDVGGHVIAPGFVDIHTHYDAQVLWDRMCTISPWHGVTSVVMGNCGFGVAPTRPSHRKLIVGTLEKVEGMSAATLDAGLGEEWPFETFPEYLDTIERRGSAINVAALIGHTPVRLYVMGEDATERAATPDEIERMRAIVREGIEAGAIGFATSKATTHVGYRGRPVPSRAAEMDEIYGLAAVLGEARKGMMQATVGPGLFFDEFARIAKDTGRNVSWTALLAGMMGPGAHRGLLARAVEQVRSGVPVYAQVTCRPLMFDYNFAEPFPFESLSLFKPISSGDHAQKIATYSDPEFRKAFKERLERPGRDGGGAFTSGGSEDRWARTEISFSPGDPSLEGRKVSEVAAARGVHPIDLILDLSIASDLRARFRVAAFNDDEDAVEELITTPETVLGLSDAGAHASQLCDACFSTYLLGHWVREKGAIRLEEAVRMLSSRPAEVFGITDRGRLEVGLAADVTVFDPDTVGASALRRVHDMPGGADRLVADARGIDLVIVNGTVIRRDGKDAVRPDGVLPGRVLRNGAARI